MTAGSAEPPPEVFLRRLWERMTALYGHTWASAHGASVTRSPIDARLTIDGETWQRALVGITGTQFAAGLEACIAEGGEFPPSAPRFRAMCLGIPTFAQVRLELRGEVRSRFAVLVWQGIDGFRYRQATADQAERMLQDAYSLAREHVMRGGALPDLPVARIEPPKTAVRTADAWVREHFCAQIRETLGIDRKSAAAGETVDA